MSWDRETETYKIRLFNISSLFRSYLKSYLNFNLQKPIGYMKHKEDRMIRNITICMWSKRILKRPRNGFTIKIFSYSPFIYAVVHSLTSQI